MWGGRLRGGDRDVGVLELTSRNVRSMAKTKDDPVVEDVDDEEISSDDDSDDVPELEEADGSARGKQSKMEKKSRYSCTSYAPSSHLLSPLRIWIGAKRMG